MTREGNREKRHNRRVCSARRARRWDLTPHDGARVRVPCDERRVLGGDASQRQRSARDRRRPRQRSIAAEPRRGAVAAYESHLRARVSRADDDDDDDVFISRVSRAATSAPSRISRRARTMTPPRVSSTPETFFRDLQNPKSESASGFFHFFASSTPTSTTGHDSSTSRKVAERSPGTPASPLGHPRRQYRTRAVRARRSIRRKRRTRRGRG